MKPLPAITPKINTFELGGYQLDFRQITLNELDLLLEVQNASKASDTVKQMSLIIELLAQLMQHEGTLEQKVSFVKAIDLSNIEDLTKLLESIMEFSGLSDIVDAEVIEKKTKKK